MTVRAEQARYAVNIPGRRWATYDDLLKCAACMKRVKAGGAQDCYRDACWFAAFERWHPEDAKYVRGNLEATEEA